MSDRIAVMSKGSLVQESAPRDLYQHPASKVVADFVGAGNFLDGEVTAELDGDERRIATVIGDVVAVCPPEARAGSRLTLLVRPENVRVETARPEIRNVFEGRVEELTFLGEFVDCRVRVQGHLLQTRPHPTLPLAKGDTVWLALRPDLCSVLMSS